MTPQDEARSSVRAGVAVSCRGMDNAALSGVVVGVLVVAAVVVHRMGGTPWILRCRTSLGRVWCVVGAVAVARQAKRQVAETARKVIIIAVCVCV